MGIRSSECSHRCYLLLFCVILGFCERFLSSFASEKCLAVEVTVGVETAASAAADAEGKDSFDRFESLFGFSENKSFCSPGKFIV